MLHARGLWPTSLALGDCTPTCRQLMRTLALPNVQQHNTASLYVVCL